MFVFAIYVREELLIVVNICFDNVGSSIDHHLNKAMRMKTLATI